MGGMHGSNCSRVSVTPQGTVRAAAAGRARRMHRMGCEFGRRDLASGGLLAVLRQDAQCGVQSLLEAGGVAPAIEVSGRTARQQSEGEWEGLASVRDRKGPSA